jgi:putative ABC transport system permease protein
MTRFLLIRLAMQNLARRPARTAALAVTVAVAVAAVFASLVLRRAVQDSMAQGFSRLGADLLVVPRDTLVNLTPTLLTAEPSPHTLDAGLADEVARLGGIEGVAPQTVFRLPSTDGDHTHDVDVIVFDPARDFTVLPWLKDRLDRPMRAGDVLVGGRRAEAVGTTLTLAGRSWDVFGRLGLTGVGPFDRGVFVAFDDMEALAGTDARPDRVSALLLRLAPDGRPEQVRFALAQMPGVKVVAGPTAFTAVRQDLRALLSSTVVLSVLVLLATALMVSLLYSATLNERRRELGLLLALGARRWQVTLTVLVEAVLTTALGGLGGVVLGAAVLVLFRRSSGFALESAGVSFLWPELSSLAWDAAGCVLLASLVGWLGALVPAWRAGRAEPNALIRAGGG